MKMCDTRAATQARIQKILRLRLVDGLSVQQIAATIFEQARSGDVRASKEILDRVEGKAVNRVELSGIGDEAIKAKVEAQLSTDDLIGVINVIYGLNRPAPKDAEPEHVH